MARQLRIEYPGAVYHVTSRGNEKKAIFKGDMDRETLLETLSQVNKRYNWLFSGGANKRGITVISGFHSAIERECLNILLKGRQSVIICPARSIEGMRIKPEYRKPLEDGRLLILSPFAGKEKRISSDRAVRIEGGPGSSLYSCRRTVAILLL